MIKKNFDDGVLYKKNGISCFFGNKFFDENKQNYFNIKSISSCKQIHSNIITEVTHNSNPVCDGIFSSKDKSIVLKIRTADCLPILLSNDDYLFAVHAGWRGLSSNIISQLKEFSFNTEDSVLIGPHIQNYEVGEDVPLQILSENPELETNKDIFLSNKENGKFLLNLSKLAELQLKEIGFSSEQVITNDINTLSNSSWNSYRRDSESTGRNFSYIFI